jgi:hypothetical protein
MYVNIRSENVEKCEKEKQKQRWLNTKI